MTGFNFPPAGWALCNGALLPISENNTLFNLIGTTYGGDGQQTFALPDFRGRIPIHQGTGAGATYILGQIAGQQQVTLTGVQIPAHAHPVQASTVSTGAVASPVGKVWSANSNTAAPQYAPAASAKVPMAASQVGAAGGSQPHENMPPFLCVNFIISLFGVFPSQN